MSVKYDDASWHTEGVFPADLPEEAAATHAGMFLAWALLNGMAGNEHSKDFAIELQELRSRRLTPGAYLMHLDGKFTDEELNDEGNGFAAHYLDFRTGQYWKDYIAILGAGLPSQYHVKDTWDNFDRLKPTIDNRYQAWRSNTYRGAKVLNGHDEEHDSNGEIESARSSAKLSTSRGASTSLSKSQIAMLKRRAANNTIEVEHLLKIARTSDSSVIPLLVELCKEHQWSYTGSEGEVPIVPLARWVEVVALYLTDGCEGLLRYACQPSSNSWEFALAVLESLHTHDAIAALAELAEAIDGQFSTRRNDAQHVIRAVGNAVASKHAPPIGEEVRVRLRDFLHAVLASTLADDWIWMAIIALEKVGDMSSIPQIKRVRQLDHPFEAVRKQAARKISKRCSSPTKNP